MHTACYGGGGNWMAQERKIKLFYFAVWTLMVLPYLTQLFSCCVSKKTPGYGSGPSREIGLRCVQCPSRSSLFLPWPRPIPAWNIHDLPPNNSYSNLAAWVEDREGSAGQWFPCVASHHLHYGLQNIRVALHHQSEPHSDISWDLLRYE